VDQDASCNGCLHVQWGRCRAHHCMVLSSDIRSLLPILDAQDSSRNTPTSGSSSSAVLIPSLLSVWQITHKCNAPSHSRMQLEILLPSCVTCVTCVMCDTLSHSRIELGVLLSERLQLGLVPGHLPSQPLVVSRNWVRLGCSCLLCNIILLVITISILTACCCCAIDTWVQSKTRGKQDLMESSLLDATTCWECL
jgi:hypothetical protein